ncbi:MAG: hypothetical protein ABL907_20515 [Hyphomicrobium sp.]
MTKPSFRPIAPLDVDDRDLERINERLGVPTMVRSAPKLPQQGDAVLPSPRPAAVTARRQQKLTVRIPAYLTDALKLQALERRTTVRQLVLLALQKDGYSIEPADLLPGAGGSD